MEYPTIRIIIPVFNDWQRLFTCLNAIGEQSYPDEQFEVIVVDNGSDCIPEIPEYNFHLEVRTCKIKGSYSARNKGLKGNQAEILVFTDSDCIPDKDWIINGVNLINNDDKPVQLVGGHINVFSQNRKPSNAELLDMAIAFPQKKYVEKSNFGVTANLFVMSEVINQAGNFNSNLKSGGDTEFCQRAVKHGFQIAYCKDAIVKHPARKTVRAILNKTKRMTGGRLDKLETKKDQYFSFLKFSKPPLRAFLYVFQASEFTVIERLRASSVLFVIWYAHFSEWLRITVLNKSSIR